MLKKEFEELTGIYPSDALYRCIEAKYMEMPMVRKENFCNYYKNNTDGIAELIQMLADEDEIARDEKHEEQKTLLKKEIDLKSLTESLSWKKNGRSMLTNDILLIVPIRQFSRTAHSSS